MIEERNKNWAVIEMFGHSMIAGLVGREDGDGNLYRVDVPDTKNVPAYTKLVGAKAIYAMTYVSEEIARYVAERNSSDPIRAFAPELITVGQHLSEMESYRERLARPAITSGENEETVDAEDLEDERDAGL